MSPLTSFGRHDRFGIEILMLCANALCQNCKKLRFLRLYAGFLFYQRPVQKLQNSAFAEFWDCTPVLALECFSAYGTGGLYPNSAQGEFWGFGLRLLISQGFLGAKAGHSDQRFGTGTALPCANALCQNLRIRRSRILRIVCRFSLWNSARCFRIQRKLNS